MDLGFLPVGDNVLSTLIPQLYTPTPPAPKLYSPRTGDEPETISPKNRLRAWTWGFYPWVTTLSLPSSLTQSLNDKWYKQVTSLDLGFLPVGDNVLSTLYPDSFPRKTSVT